MNGTTGRAAPLSHWLATAHRPARPRLEEDLSTDVAVVGGGIAGLMTAWELVRAGRETVLLEADQILSGTTGFTTGKLTALHGLRYERLRHTAGTEGAELYAASQQDALAHAAACCAEWGIDAELERRSAYTYVRADDRVREIRAETAAARTAGLDAHFVTETPLPFPVAAAVRLDEQYQFHPAAFLTALADAFTAAGGRIFEHTRVTSLHEQARIRLESADGFDVHASDAVVATHFPAFGPISLMVRLTPRRELVVAAPVPLETDPDGMYITPEDDTRSVRTAPYGRDTRLLIVTGEAFRPGDGDVAERRDRLETWARAYFPGFGETGPVLRWAAQDVDPVDGLPFVGHPHPGTEHVYVATGFGGWGMSGGIMAGRLLAAFLTGGPRPPWAELYDPRRLPPVREVPGLLKSQASVAGHFVGDRLHLPGPETVADLAPGSGTVVRDRGHAYAVHRDASGTLRTVSARCTHMGCLVAFNDAEEAWECPCHGSRFAPDGSVLQGPATEPLEAADDPRS
ncbi:FAD-dependent oxidoreductase [Streptomyces purpureus]|uniref:FAD-dependent oxidoreductase n=1 Tax=Streptomyces purpureus TaxID=1951 RepID=UPI00036DC43F|nr:FAD-dependent oxidoreductase [Streptomyces purpureus]